MKTKLLGVVMSFVCGTSIAACPSTCQMDPKPVPPTPVDGGPLPPPLPDATILPPTCASACAKLRSLNCDEGKPTKAGASCETVCTNNQEAGLYAWDLDCVANRIRTCADVPACPRR